MITAEDNITCRGDAQNRLGFSALYETCNDDEIEVGTVLCGRTGKLHFLFQVGERFCPLYDEVVKILPGTLEHLPGSEGFFEGTPKEDCMVGFCRFPLQEELKWYESIDTV